MRQQSRREFKSGNGGNCPLRAGLARRGRLAQAVGDRPRQAKDVRVLHPQTRTPVSLLIDDSTCLVNLAHFAMPQFGEVRPDSAEYQKPWQTTPREIPDRFVRKFGLWCRRRGIKGKYSIIPYVRQPAELIVCLDLPKGKSQLRV